MLYVMSVLLLFAGRPEILIAPAGFKGVLPRDGPEPVTPRTRKANMERMIAKVGEEARPLVEAYQDEAVAALRRCSVDVGKKLSRFYPDGLAKIPQPHRFLSAIGDQGHGDDVALWGMAHVDELQDQDAMTAFLMRSLEYSLGLRNLSQGAAEVRARRIAGLEQAEQLQQPAPEQQSFKFQMPIGDKDAQTRQVGWCIGFGILLIVGVWWWKKRNAAA